MEVDEVDGISARLDALLEHVGQLGPRLHRQVDAIEVRQGLLLQRIHREDVLVRLFGLGDVTQLVLEDAREALPDGGLDGLVLVRAEDVRKGVGQMVPTAFDGRREARGLLAGLLVERVFLDGADVDLERCGGVDELLFVELGDPIVRREALLGTALAVLGRLRRRVGQLGLVDVTELLPVPGGTVERLENLADFDLLRPTREEGLERLQRLGVLGRRVQHVAIRRDGLIEVAELRLMHLSEAVLQLEDLVGRLPDLRLASEDGGKVRPAFGLHEEAVEGLDRRLVLDLRVEDAAVAARAE